MTARSRQLAIAVTGAALALAGCGGSNEPEGEELPPEVALALNQQLDSVGDRVAAGIGGACDDIYDSRDAGGNIEPIDETLDAIPDGVDADIRSSLRQSIDRLKRLVDEECDDIRAAEQQEQGETTPEEIVTEETVPDETETERTDTDAQTETETTPEPDSKPEKPEKPEKPGRGPDGDGPPGLDRGGVEAPSDEEGGD